MSYSPATKLSHSNATNKATVLTNGNVMVTLGLGVGQMMTLEDWRILADGATIVEERAALPVASQPPAAPGTKFRWTLDENNYCVAIMTAKGLLQVKSMWDGEADFKKTLFADEKAWRASESLNDSGTIEISLDDKSAEKRRADEAYQTLGDVEKVEALVKRYQVKSFVQQASSPQNSLDAALKLINDYRAEFAQLTLEEELRGHRHRLNLKMNRALRSYAWANSRVAAGEPEERPPYVCYRGKNQIIATVKGMPYVILPFMGKIAAYPSSSYLFHDVKLYNNFAEMGNPTITARYRCRTIAI